MVLEHKVRDSVWPGRQVVGALTTGILPCPSVKLMFACSVACTTVAVVKATFYKYTSPTHNKKKTVKPKNLCRKGTQCIFVLFGQLRNCSTILNKFQATTGAHNGQLTMTKSYFHVNLNW